MPRTALACVALVALGCARPDGGADPVPAPVPRLPEVQAVAARPFAPPPAPPEPIRVLVGGDVVPHRPLRAPSAIASALAPLTPTFADADAVVLNYETATGKLADPSLRLTFGVGPEWFEALPASGVTAVTVANNHACDLGLGGVRRTLAIAEESNVVAIGGDSEGDPWQPRTIAEREGKRVCAVGWTTFVNADRACEGTDLLAIAPENTAGRRDVVRAITRARASCDATVAIMHGGLEYVPQTPAVMAVAKQAAEAGADAVVIHHPHVPSPVVVHATKDGRAVPIFASVGNFVSNQGESWKLPMYPVLSENRRLVCANAWTRLGVLADLSFDLGPSPALTWGYHLLWTENDHAVTRSPTPNIATRVLDPEGDAALLSRLADDPLGPLELFRDPCWIERPSDPSVDGEGGDGTARCRTTLVRSAPPPGPVAVRAKSPAKKRR